MNEQPNYYAILTANVRYDDELCASEKLLYAEITALSNKEGYCWSTNNYFAKLYRVDVCTVSRWVNKLVKKGYLISQIIRDENTKQILERRLYIADPSTLNINRGIDEKINRGIDKKVKRGIDKKVKDNSTRVNTTSNNIYSTEKNFLKNEERKKPPTLNEIESFIAEKKLSINAKDFYDHYCNNEWIDNQGKLITKSNYRLKVSMWNKNNFQSSSKTVTKVEPKRPDSKVYVAPTENSREPINIDKELMLLQATAVREQKCSASEVFKLTKEELKAKLVGIESPKQGSLLAEVLGKIKYNSEDTLQNQTQGHLNDEYEVLNGYTV